MEQLSASLEMYLKTIYNLSKEDKDVHAKDIAWQLEVTRPSVTGALKQLAEKDLIKYAPYEAVQLTKKGQKAASAVVKRFDILLEFFTNVLDVKKDEAARVACEVEHAMQAKVLERLVSFIDYIRSCPRGDVVWINSEKRFKCTAKEACPHHPEAADSG